MDRAGQSVSKEVITKQSPKWFMNINQGKNGRNEDGQKASDQRGRVILDTNQCYYYSQYFLSAPKPFIYYYHYLFLIFPSVLPFHSFQVAAQAA
jgi:hypothetical protein